MYFECRHIMPNGARCHSPALRGKNFCYYHTRLHLHANPSRPTPTTKTAPPPALVPASLLPPDSEPLRVPVLEDRSAIQVALSQIMDALATSKLDPRRAGMLLYALQIATQNVERKQDILPFKAVQSVVRTSNGDELAPRLRICEPSDKCSTCEFRSTCKDFEPDEDEDDVEP